MSAWVSAAPVIGTGSLDGFAIGALMSGACALAITAPRRARRPLAARDGAQAAGRSGWLCEHVMAAEAGGSGLAAEAGGSGLAAEAAVAAAAVVGGAMRTEAPRAELAGVATGTRLATGAGAERLARPEELGAHGESRSAGGPYARAAGGYRSRHRRGDPIPGRAHPGRAHRDDVSPGIVFPDAEIALVPFASPRRPEARCLPRHAAPSVGLGSRITGFGSRMTGLFATRALARG